MISIAKNVPLAFQNYLEVGEPSPCFTCLNVFLSPEGLMSRGDRMAEQVPRDPYIDLNRSGQFD